MILARDVNSFNSNGDKGVVLTFAHDNGFTTTTNSPVLTFQSSSECIYKWDYVQYSTTRGAQMRNSARVAHVTSGINTTDNFSTNSTIFKYLRSNQQRSVSILEKSSNFVVRLLRSVLPSGFGDHVPNPPRHNGSHPIPPIGLHPSELSFFSSSTDIEMDELDEGQVYGVDPDTFDEAEIEWFSEDSFADLASPPQNGSHPFPHPPRSDHPLPSSVDLDTEELDEDEIEEMNEDENEEHTDEDEDEDEDEIFEEENVNEVEEEATEED